MRIEGKYPLILIYFFLFFTPLTSSAASDPITNELFKTNALFEKYVGLAARFAPIPPGTFDMGSPEDEVGRESDENLHSVYISQDFEMQITPVTQLQYYYVTHKAPSAFKAFKYCDPDNYKVVAKGKIKLCAHHPVDSVSWDEAQLFVQELNKIQDQYNYRLPTEAEWEYAARGSRPSSFPYFFGFNDENDLVNFAWYVRNSANRTQMVGTLKANPFGLYDMYGNVWQWTQDYYGPYSLGDGQLQADPKGLENGTDRVLRGGSWNLDARFLRSAHRFFALPTRQDKHFSFRLVRTARSLKR